MLTRRSLIASIMSLPILNLLKPKGELLDGKRSELIESNYKDTEIELIITWEYLNENQNS